MSPMHDLALPGGPAARAPFPHLELPAALAPAVADETLAWLEREELWRLRVEDFYEQHEFSLLTTPPPSSVAGLTGETVLERLRAWLRQAFAVTGGLELVDVSAHRLTAGQTIRIHNDHLDGTETHRVLVQLNRGWTADRGGILMLFADDDPASLAKAILPVHRDGFAFEISPHSYHAVSTVHSGERYTLVYTWQATSSV